MSENDRPDDGALVTALRQLSSAASALCECLPTNDWGFDPEDNRALSQVKAALKSAEAALASTPANTAQVASAPDRAGVAFTAERGSANSHCMDDQILAGDECIAFAREEWTDRILAALSATPSRGGEAS